MKILMRAGIAAAIIMSIQLIVAQISAFGSKAPIVTTGQIQSLQTDDNSQGSFVIVDVREKAETDVSVIPGAITRAEFERTADQQQGKAVLVYCTVGHRSGIYAQKLRRDGWNAWNYEGSILDWCNNHLPVVTRQGQSTNRVHTFSSRYSVARGYQAVN